MLVKRWMTKEVISVKKGATLKQAAALMWKHQIRQLPVLDGDRFIGMLHDRDLQPNDPRQLDTDIFQNQSILEKTLVEERMQRKVPYVTPETNFEAVVSIMLNKKITAIPVIENGKVVGIVCDDDMFRAFAEITGLKADGLRFSLKINVSDDPMTRISEVLGKFGNSILGVITFRLPDKPDIMRVMLQVKPEATPDILQFMESKGYQTDDLMKLFQNVFAN
jgi:acetoin utilization protein AcuB